MKKPTKKQIAALAFCTVMAVVAVGLVIGGKSHTKNTTITKEDMQAYREMIGDGMNEKRAIFILFNTKEECESFIAEHGSDKEPEKAGIGVTPLMENGYSNIVGKVALEAVFDNLKDGEYSQTPVEYSGKFCYLKRIKEYNPLDDNKVLIKLIMDDRASKKDVIQ